MLIKFHKILATLPRLCLYALLVFTPLAVASAPTWAIMVIHIITLIAITGYLTDNIAVWDWHRLRTPLDMPLATLLLVVLLSTVFSTDRYTSTWSAALMANYIAIFYLTVYSITTRGRLRQLLQAIVFMACFLSIFGLIKLSGANPFPWWDYDTGYTHSVTPPSSTFFNPNHFAGYLAMSLPVCVGLLMTGQGRGKKSIFIAAALLISVALVFSLARGGWISTCFGMAFMGAVLLLNSNRAVISKKVLLLIAGSLFLVGLVFLFSTPAVEEALTLKEVAEDANLGARIAVWHQTVRMILDYPLLGAGPGTYYIVFSQYQPTAVGGRYFNAHNDYLQFVAETGLTTVLVMVWLIIACYRSGLRKLTHPSRLVKGSTLGALSGISAILLYSVSDFNLHIPANAVLFSVLAAIVVSPPPEWDTPFLKPGPAFRNAGGGLIRRRLLKFLFQG